METMALGFFALVFLIISICCMYYKKPIGGIVCSVATMALTYLTGHSWKEMLIGSGKNTTLLGFNRYPAALIILAMLFSAAFILMIVSIIGIVRQNKSKA